jgi:hypothetical protein
MLFQSLSLATAVSCFEQICHNILAADSLSIGNVVWYIGQIYFEIFEI